MSERPTRAERDAAVAAGVAIPDVVAVDLRVLFCGINPGAWSGASGNHFAGPGNRFWKALARSGLTDRELRPSEKDRLLDYGLGVTNLVARTTARADDLDPDEFVAGAERLVELVARLRPRWVAILGMGAYRTGFGVADARIGPQTRPIGGARVWLLPNPSPLNAHYRLPGLVAAFAELRAAIDAAG